jgi:hypothetical protein
MNTNLNALSKATLIYQVPFLIGGTTTGIIIDSYLP